MAEQLTTPKQGVTTSNNLHEKTWYLPFRVLEQTTIKDEKTTKKYIITLGQSIISPKEFKTKIGAELYLATKPYELMVNMICDIINKFKEDETTK